MSQYIEIYTKGVYQTYKENKENKQNLCCSRCKNNINTDYVSYKDKYLCLSCCKHIQIFNRGDDGAIIYPIE